MKSVMLGLRLLCRDWRVGELAVLVFALLLAVAASTAVNLLAERWQRSLHEQAAELLGADLLVESHQPLPAEWREQADKLGLRQTQTLEFPSMAAAGERFLLVGVKAVQPGYPLRGALQTTRTMVGQNIIETQPTGDIPATGEAWVDARLLTELGISLDGTVELGRLHLKITRLLSREPDRRADFYSFSPRLLMNAADIPASALIQPGSRLHYHGLYAGLGRAAFKDWLQPRLQAGQRLLDIDQNQPELGDTLTRAERYLGLAAVMVALLSGVAIATATRRYALRHYDTVALLRCLGAQQREVRLIFASQLLLLGLVAALLGVATGWLMQEALVYLLRPLLPMAPAKPAWIAVWAGAASGLLVLVAFAWPALVRLERLTPLRVLRRDLQPPSPALGWVGLGIVLTAAVLVWRYAEHGLNTALLLLGGAALVVLVTGMAWALLVCSRRWQPQALAWRFALRSLNRQPGRSLAQIAAFAITLAAMTISLIVRNDMLDDWRGRLDVHAPNYFVINLFEADRQRFVQRLSAIGAGSSQVYPVVRGRLTHINGQPALALADKDSQGERALNRELNLTWTSQLPSDNRIIAGDWNAAGVSLEQKLAESLHITLGSKLRFTIADRPLEVTVTSLRSLHWDSMTPNFYVIFPPGQLDGFPYSYLTSFYLPGERYGELAGLSREFPGITLLDVEQMLRQLQAVLKRVTLAIDGVMLLALAAGIAVLWAAVLNQRDERLHEDALLRVFGAERRLLRHSRRLEFALLGGLAGLLAVVLAEALMLVLYTRLLQMAFVPHLHWWLLLPALGAILVAVCGLLLTRRAVTLSPLTVLREG